MLLAVDIGNTQTHLGAFDGTELAHDWRLGTDPHVTADELAVTLAGLLGLAGLSFESIDASIVSTVVPQLGPEYRELCERHTRGGFLKVGPNLKTGMPILVDNPHELGADRLVNAMAAHDQIKGACVTVDFGTSTNFDVVSGAGEYLGGVIGPGVEISLEALTARTAKLPRIDVSSPPAAIGRHTVAAIQSGFAYGFAGLVDGINRRIAEELGEGAGYIATGGLAGTIAPHCETIDSVDPLLTLKGLRLIHERNA
ncbi:MAG TPA: type III pantothenate kinase [Solirubrobacterales bacterium]|jgi:type III pantothenate kinase|nr:type III pantothenate kinase [Solirubrobacterales bacterium]